MLVINKNRMQNRNTKEYDKTDKHLEDNGFLIRRYFNFLNPKQIKTKTIKIINKFGLSN